ncbi:hypothetical protein WOLCODRAFT_51656, partial [Wolfiporia cocos MD-104 SS10]
YKEEIDTLLTFAGLFSAVVSVFSVDEYTTLFSTSAQTTSDAAVTHLILMQISSQLSSLSVNPGYINSTVPAFSTSLASEVTSSASYNSEVVNILWFSSLMLSLGAASIGISARQWLNYHVGHTSNTPIQSVRIWHLRHTAFIKWRIPQIIAILPVLLQIALVLFLVGLVIRLWPLNQVVAHVMAALLAILSAFLIVTAILPTFNTSCPYKSPQAWW